MAEESAPAKKKQTPAVPTSYLVQRRIEGGDDKHPRWEDFKMITATGAEKAMKLAAGEGELANAGEFRAFPTRSDNRLIVEVQQKLEVSYKPSHNGAKTETKEKASAST